MLKFHRHVPAPLLTLVLMWQPVSLSVASALAQKALLLLRALPGSASTFWARRYRPISYAGVRHGVDTRRLMLSGLGSHVGGYLGAETLLY